MLQIYDFVIKEFYPSLKAIEAFEKNITNRTKYDSLVAVVQTELRKAEADIGEVIKVKIFIMMTIYCCTRSQQPLLFFCITIQGCIAQRLRSWTLKPRIRTLNSLWGYRKM